VCHAGGHTAVGVGCDTLYRPRHDGAALGAARSPPLDGPGLHELVEDHCLVPLSRCENKGHEVAIPFRPQVDFGTETAPAPTEC
jgi:hypothetical protein